MKTLLLLSLVAYASASVSLSGRVVGGNNAGNSAPFIVSFQQSTSKGYQHFCGGSIINADWILTAAHCITSQSLAAKTSVFAGCTNIADPDKTCTKRTISKYKNHNLYVGGIAPYDIGLVKVNQPFSFSSSIASIALPAANSQPSGDCTLFGWGSTSATTTPSFPVNLQQVVLPIISLQACEAALGKPAAINVHNTNVCTGPLTGGKGICTSDSGGPLVSRNTLVGIVSWGKNPCGQVNNPSVFVRVSAFTTWIKDNQN